MSFGDKVTVNNNDLIYLGYIGISADRLALVDRTGKIVFMYEEDLLEYI